MTPHDAITAGADFLVIGRPISAADNPVLAAENIQENFNRIRAVTVTVKICGINDEASLKAAVTHGARFVGFVFYPVVHAVKPATIFAVDAKFK